MKSILAVYVAILIAVAGTASTSPTWLASAIENLPEEIPAGLAYTLEIERNGRQSAERFDPSRATEERWRLLTLQGQAPAAGDIAEYSRGRARSTEPGFRSSIRRDQVDLSTARVLEESATHATVRIGFRPSAIETDKMLGRLELTLEIRKQPAAVQSYRMQLPAPYSPVIGVKMLELDAGAEFDGDARPLRTWSRFRGRIFFKSVDESVAATYRDYVQVSPPE